MISIPSSLTEELAALRGHAQVELAQLGEDLGLDLSPPDPAGRRLTNAARRPREYLTAADEVDRLMAAARSRGGRYGHRDATMILLAYRHGLRVSELTSLRWDMLDLAQCQIHVQRLKNGRPSVHTVRGTELRALRRLQREQNPPLPLPVHHRAAHPDHRRRVQKAVNGDRRGGRTPLPGPSPFAAPCLRLRPRQWQARYRAIQEWLGHRNIQHTTRYTELTTHPFRDFWQRED